MGCLARRGFQEYRRELIQARHETPAEIGQPSTVSCSEEAAASLITPLARETRTVKDETRTVKKLSVRL